jgi:hypothetical protein
MLGHKKTKANVVVGFSLLIFFYILVKNAIFAPFTVEDEYNNFYWANPDLIFGPESNYFKTVYKAIVGFIFQGRLLITHLIVIVARAKIFGINPLFHHLTVFLFGFGSAFALYKIFEKAAFSRINACIGALIYLTGYAYSEIFFRLSSGECTGNLFLLMAIYFIVSFVKNNLKSHFYWCIFFGFFAALSKESYLILFPLIFAVPFLFIESSQWKIFLQQNMNFVYLIAFCFVVLILSLFLTIKSSGIVFSYGEPLSKFDTFINNITWLFKWFLVYVPIVLTALILYIRKNNIGKILPFIIFCAGWIISQLVVYYKVIISFSQGRYMVPAGLIFIVMIVIALEYLQSNTKVYKYALVLIGLLLIRNAKIVYINANEFGARAAAFNTLIDQLVNEKHEKIAVYGGVEFFQSIQTHFIFKGYHPQLITTPVIYKKDYLNTYNDQDYKNELQNRLNDIYEFRSLKDLQSDTTIHVMITAEPEEYLPINYPEVMKTFKKFEKVNSKFANPGLRESFSKDFWMGELKNDQRSYLVFTK